MLHFEDEVNIHFLERLLLKTVLPYVNKNSVDLVIYPIGY